MVYIEFQAQSDVYYRAPANEKLPIFDKWENFVETHRSKAPNGMKSLFQTAGFCWAWMPTEYAFVISASQGIAISITFAFMVLLIATRNII